MQSLQQVFMITSRQQLFFDREHRYRGPKNMKISSQFFLPETNEKYYRTDKQSKTKLKLTIFFLSS